MPLSSLFGKKPLWADAKDVDQQTMPMWRAFVVALGIELLTPFVIFGIDTSFLSLLEEPPPIELMSVRLDDPPPPPEELDIPPEIPEEELREKRREPKPLKDVKNVTPIEPPKPLPNEVPSKIEVPKPEPEPEPEPEEEELPPLPSVFQDVKPVRKIKPKYPREAEDKHIEGEVLVRLWVDLDGTVSKAEILRAEPPGVFDEEVMKAVRKYQFRRDGTSYTADQLIIFKIDPPQ